MVHHVYKIDRSKVAKLGEATSDPIVSKLSITTRDSEVLGVPGDCVYVLLEGGDEGLATAKRIIEGNLIGRKVPDDIADQVKAAIDAEEDAAAEGMGALFG